MNREILFRAKRKDNGKWIEGSLLNFRENTYMIPHDSEYCYDDTEKFCKTDLEYMHDRERAKWILDAKGLESFRDGDVVTTRERKEVI